MSFGGVAVMLHDGSFPDVDVQVFVTPFGASTVMVYVMGGFTKVSIATAGGVVAATSHQSPTGVVMTSGFVASLSIVVQSKSTSCPMAITHGLVAGPNVLSLHFNVHCGLSFTVTEQALGTVTVGFDRSNEYVF